MLETDPSKLPPMPAPKFATPRDPAYYSIGPLQSQFARTWYRRPLLRWQDLVLDVAGEQLPDGRPRYGFGVVTVQRQAGKTDVMLVSGGERCMSRPQFRYGHTAQTGEDARDQMKKYAEEVVEVSPLGSLVDVRRGNSQCDITFRNKSTIVPRPPTATKGHGNQFDLYDIDEGWAFDMEQGDAVLQAVAPTQLTRPFSQIRVWSAGGTADSTWLAELVARGRAADPTMFYFEWGIPDDLPLDDDALIASYHPAYGELVDTAAITKLRSIVDPTGTNPAAFARAAGNRWTEVIGGLISADLWKGLRYGDPVPEGTPIGFGAARSQDGTQVAIVSAVQDGDRIIVEVCDVLPTAWRAAEHIRGWVAGDTLAIGRSGASAGLYDDLLIAGSEPLGLGGRDASAACSQLYDALPHKAIVFREHPDLDAAVRIAGKRTVDGGGWVWAHTGQGQIAVLEAATYAVWALKHRQPTPGAAVFAA